MEIFTNNIPRPILEAYELSEAERKEFDFLDWDAIEAGTDSASFFRYKRTVHYLGDFTTTSGLDGKLDLWDGYHNDTFFSGTLVKYTNDPDYIIVGRYFA